MHVFSSKNPLVVSTLLVGMLGATSSATNAASFSLNFESGLPPEALFFQEQPEGAGIIPFTPSIETINGNNVLRLSDDLPLSQGGANTRFC